MVREETPNDTLSPANLSTLCRIVYQDSGIVLDESKRYLLEARLKPLAESRGLASLDQLSERVGLDAALRRQTVEAMTTNETFFFRDLAPFDALRQTIIPKLVQRRAPARCLSLWFAACSSGQEPYSVAMLLRETVPDLDQWKVEMVATDISDAMLGRARQGRYTRLEVNRGLPAQYLVKYFQPDRLDWVLKPEVRAMVTFKAFNLNGPMVGLGTFDLVFCRNVLIYFDTALKKKILAGIRNILAPDGYLLLGGAETILSLDDHYERTVIGQASFYRLK